MPKRRPDSCQSVRIELQQSERDILEMYAASAAYKNITTGTGNLFSGLVTPLTTCTLAGAATAAMIIETILFTQDKGLFHGLFGFGEKIGTWTWDLKSAAQKNYQDAKNHVTNTGFENTNYQHTEEIDKRQAEVTAKQYQIEYVWSDQVEEWRDGIRYWGAWVNPKTGEIVSWDRSIDPNRGSDI